jgi:transposase
MSIPKEILAVERPTNTVVYVTSAGNYGVKKRIGCRYVNGKNRPINGPTVGHIIDGKYVPIEEKKEDTSSMAPALLDWADARLCEDLFSDMIPEFEKVYSHDDAMKLYAMAVLRVCDPDVKDCELQERYADSFLSVLHPGIPLSRNTVSKFLSDIGKQLPLIYEFMQNRAEKVGIDHHLLIDGTLKSDDSAVNSLSDFSYKTRLKNRNDISVLYAFDLERQEPVCSLCYPGNMLDVTSYSDFIEKCGISEGIIVADKGFPVSAIRKQLKEREGLHYLSPLRRNDLMIKDHDMLSFEGILTNERENIQYRKCSLPDGRFLYSFRDPARALKEESDYLRNRKRNNDYDADNYRKKRGSFGTIVFVSDTDLTPSQAWRCYASRWEIELVMRFYKHALDFDDTREHTDYSVYASEFVDFLSETLTYRMINRFKEKGLLETQTYSKMLKTLKRAKKVRIGDEWKLVRINPAEEERLKKLGLLPGDGPRPKRKRGRPRKQAL